MNAVEENVYLHDLHVATLRRLGLDHERLTYGYLGRDWLRQPEDFKSPARMMLEPFQ